MDLIENIRIFRRVAEKKSFSSVASEFEVTQPTISKAVAALEEHLEVTLFRRSTRGLSLTSEGQKLFISGGAVLDQFDQMLASVKNEKLLLQGQLRITASLAFARLILAPLFEEFLGLHPKLRFHFHLSDGYVDLVKNNIDLALRIGDLPDSGLKAFKVGVSKRSFYASKRYLKTHGTPKTLESLRDHRLMFHTRLRDNPSLPLVNDAGKDIQFAFEPYFQSDGSDLIREAVLRDVGIAYLPTWMMIGHEELIIAPLDRFVSKPSPIYVVSSGSQELTAKQRAFAEFVRLRFEGIGELSLRDRARSSRSPK